MVAKLQPHILRTLLWNSLDQLTNVMVCFNYIYIYIFIMRSADSLLLNIHRWKKRMSVYH